MGLIHDVYHYNIRNYGISVSWPNTGYKGRTGIVEILDGTDEMKSLIQSKAKMEKLREQAVKDGMTTLMQDGIRKVLEGITDLQQVRRVCIK